MVILDCGWFCMIVCLLRPTRMAFRLRPVCCGFWTPLYLKVWVYPLSSLRFSPLLGPLPFNRCLPDSFEFEVGFLLDCESDSEGASVLIGLSFAVRSDVLAIIVVVCLNQPVTAMLTTSLHWPKTWSPFR